MATLEAIRAALAGRYTIERELGAGGMATVYLAEDAKHHRKVAVKVLRPEIAATLGADRFAREIEVAARLQHPHILPLLDSGEAAGFFYYVMPFVPGESLRDRLARHGELPVHDAIKILIEVVDALAHAHASGVVHRDIKPDNILLSGRHALVTDFGVAKAVSEATGRQTLTTAGVALGTPAYMAPEQAAADPHLDHRVDVYAVGALAYELLTGRPPFTGRSPQEVLAAHVTQVPEPVERHRDGLSPQLSQVVMRCLAKRPADRWQTAEELLAQLEPLATPSQGITPTTTRPVAAVGLMAPSRARLLWAGVGGVAVVLLIVLTAMWQRRGNSSVVQLGRRTQVTLDPGLEVLPALSPDGALIAYTGPGNQLYVRQVDGGTPVRVSGDQAFAAFAAWTPDGGRIIWRSPRGIESVPALGGASRLLVPAPVAFSPVYIGNAVSPDGASLAYATSESLLVRPLAGGPERLITRGANLHSPSWSGDGRWIAYVSGNPEFLINGNIAPSSIWIVAAGGGTPHRVTDERALNVSPAWDADGGLLYVSSRDGGRDIYRVTIRGSGRPSGAPGRVTTGANAHSISISADGKRLAYASFTETSNVWSVPAPVSGTASIAQARPLTTGNQTIENFTFSPDGQWIAFDSDRGGQQRIYRMRVTGGEPEQLTSDSADTFFPDWSADGREIAYHGFRGGHRELFIIPADGGTAIQITSGSDDLRAPRWTPDGGLMTFANVSSQRGNPRIITRLPNGGWSDPVTWPLVLDGDTLQQEVANVHWSPDGRLAACGCATLGVVVSPAAGGQGRRLVPAPPGAGLLDIQWSEDGRRIYYLTDQAIPTVWVVPAGGGTPRVVLRFDDPTRPWHRYGFRVKRDRIYFTLGEAQGDISVAELTP